MSDHVCPWWIAWTFDNPLRRLVHPSHRILEPYVKTGDTVADLGAGMGYFTIAMAALVGPDGQVLCVDLQPGMLARARRRAERLGLLDRIRFIQCAPDDLKVDEPVRFALAFWMVHEVGDQARFFRQLHTMLEMGGRFLMAEPRVHVRGTAFQASLDRGEAEGLRVTPGPKIALSHAALFERI